MAFFFFNKNLVFIDSMQFMDSSLALKTCPTMISNIWLKNFVLKLLELLKQKDAYPYEYIDSFKIFGEEKLPDGECFYSSVKDGTTNDSGEKFDSHISDEDYLTCKKNLE